MSSELRGNTSTDPRLATLNSLADAADALTKAVATLAAAARATAEAFAQDVARSPSPEENPGINFGRGSDLASEIAFSEKGDSDLRQDKDTGDGGERSIAIPVGSDYGQVDTPVDTDTGEQDVGISNPMNSPYRILVDSEADVLLFVCALIDKRQKVVCYMPCGTPPLKTYMQLMEKVTESPIYVLNSSTSLKQDQNYLNFLNSNGAVLLIPESLLPQFKIGGDNSWVIHAGWPVNEAQYTAQRRNHQAQNNVLVACSRDQSLYPSGNSIVKLTEPWPKDGPSFRASVSILRSLYEVMLSEIPLDMKSRIYMDYIQFHGVHGPRRVESWTPSMVVQRANDHLMKVWLWSGEHTGGDNIPLPEVSAGFVAQNDLQSAVQEGLIQVEDDSDDPGLSPSSPWNMSTTPGIPDSYKRQEEIPYRTSAAGEPLIPPTPTIPRPESVFTQPEFEPTTGLTFFPYAEEFDVIPLMCFIAGKYNKVICFVEGQGALRTYHDLFGRVAGRTVFFPKILNDHHAIEEAVVRFISAVNPAILLLAHNTTNLPSILSQSRVDCCIYWGFTVVPLQQAKQNRPLINCDTTIIIMMGTQLKGLSGAHDLRKHPSGTISMDLSENSTLAPIRNRTKAILAAPRSKTIVDGLYTSRVYSVAAIPRRVVSAQEVARRVNQYAARVLLHGELADGSATFPPVAGRLVTPKTAVERFNLQPAVDAGLLRVGN
ncbi:hypothetical protein B0J17DRAFT_231480 [Rhizoctonia solani]|nr:hypothetical protein B0J17DRAFT_231480 [Rhizoctonia solani]